jgi:hypothetical protein
MAILKTVDSGDLASPYALLAAQGINVWTQSDISAYMKRQVADYPGNWAWRLQRRLPLNLLRKLIMGTTIISFLIFVITMVLVSGMGIHTPSLVMTLLVSASISLALVIYLLLDDYIKVKGVEWNERPVNVASALPSFVLLTMAKAKALFPHHSFVIAELRETTTYAIVDPVLFIEIMPDPKSRKRERIALLVWDEHNNEVLPPNH